MPSFVLGFWVPRMGTPLSSGRVHDRWATTTCSVLISGPLKRGRDKVVELVWLVLRFLGTMEQLLIQLVWRKICGAQGAACSSHENMLLGSLTVWSNWPKSQLLCSEIHHCVYSGHTSHCLGCSQAMNEHSRDAKAGSFTGRLSS